MIIAGVDPGLAVTGFGLIQVKGNLITPLKWGVIRSGKGELATRLKLLHNRLAEILLEHKPDLVAVEDIFFGANPRSALMLGHARGVLLLAAELYCGNVHEYPARLIKQSVVGRGGASKEQVRFMVSKLLRIDEKDMILDASDALAAAICCSIRG